MADIVNIIMSNEYIIGIKEEKAVMIGSVKFRFFAEVTYDIDVSFFKFDIFIIIIRKLIKLSWEIINKVCKASFIIMIMKTEKMI